MTSYSPSLETALRYIERHLDHPVTAAQIAQAAGFSPYHFHRIFHAASGETVMGYLRKRRLSEAARCLLESDHAILDIALQCQFESQAAFSRAFKRMFGISPGQYRKDRLKLSLSERLPLNLDILAHLKGGMTMTPTLLTLPAISTIGLEARVKPMDPRIPELWDRFMARIAEIPGGGPRHFGICQADQTDPESGMIRYTAAAEAQVVTHVPPRMVVQVLPEHTYAVFTHKGGLERLPDTLRYIWSTWLPKSGYQQADLPDFELYDERFHPTAADSEFDIYLPVLPKRP